MRRQAGMAGYAISFVAALLLIIPARLALAQEAEVVETIAKEITEGLGKDTAEFGGDEMVQQTAKRLATEATAAAGESGVRIIQEQVERVMICRDTAAIFDLKLVRGDTMPLLEDISDAEIPKAMAALSRSEIEEGLESFSSSELRTEALMAEMRLPGEGLTLVRDFGAEGSSLASTLTEDQANSVLEGLRPAVLEDLSGAERSELLNALASRPDARLANFEKLTGPLMVVAGGLVIWHGENLVLSPNERVTDLPDGTVIRESTPIGSQVVQAMPQVATVMSSTIKWSGISAVAGVTVVFSVYIWLRHRRLKTSSAK